MGEVKEFRVSSLSSAAEQRRFAMEPRQFCFSRADGQMRSRAESDLPDSSESSGRSTLEVLHAEVFCIGFDNERQCTNPDPNR